MAAVPEFGRAARVEPPASTGADVTRDLFERFASQIYGYCLHQLGSREEAEDAVQTTFMNVFRGLQRGIVPRVEGAWLFKIAHNVCLSRRRSTRRRGRVETPNNLEVLQDVVPARDRSTDELMRLHDALEGMPETQRRAILLREWQGLSYREIADSLEISQAAVETLIFRARRSLAAGLREPAQENDWRKRARHGVDAGGVLAALKGLFATATTAKVAATVAAVATTTAIVTTDVSHQHRRSNDAVGRHAPLAVLTSDVAPPVQPVAKTVVTHEKTDRPLVTPTRARKRRNVRPTPARRPAAPSREGRATPASHAHVAVAPASSAVQVEKQIEKPKAGNVATPPKPRKAVPGHSRADNPQQKRRTERAPAPQQEQTEPVEQPAPQASDEHGHDSAPGQQQKVDKPDDHAGNGN